MEDAFRRDQAAWELAQSGESLLRAFTAYRGADQYGGLLWISAWVYRSFGGEAHRPFQMVVITAAFAALAVVYTWAFTRRVFGASAAKWAAWGLALYPEAVLLGSSQMREAFVMTLAGGAFYGLVRYRQEGARGALGWVAAGLGLMLPISPPLTGISLGLLALVGMAMGGWRLRRDRRLWAALGGVAALVLGGVWLGWEHIVPQATAKRFATPAAMFAFWVRQVARWQAYLTYRASGWVQKILRATPAWFDLPFVVGYGVVRPLLPAALIAGGPLLWQAIGVWRALGWTALLLLLMYAPLRALRERGSRPLALWLSLAVWLTIVIASFWGGGDQWDNPRYRVAFVSLHMALGGWVVAGQLRQAARLAAENAGRSGDGPVLDRAVVSGAVHRIRLAAEGAVRHAGAGCSERNTVYPLGLDARTARGKVREW
jgi:4-amino-4-deoxy-L-arabinose transferase-like glycosyltransferase